MSERSRVAVGVDVVWLADPRKAKRVDDARFVRRILAPEEQDLLRAVPPHRAHHLLWELWAGKEAAFKVVSKLEGTPPPFRHAAFVQTPLPALEDHRETGGLAAPGDETRMWQVRWHHHVVAARTGLHHPEALVAVATPRRLSGAVLVGVGRTDEAERLWGAPEEELRARLTPRELEAVHSPASAAVRVAAKVELAALLGLDEGGVEIVCPEGVTGRRPPHVLLDGHRAAGLDVSLSHDGRWLAWAVAYAG